MNCPYDEQWMFSQRTNWSLAVNPLMARLKVIRQQQEKIIDLTESNPTVCGFQYPKEEILSALANPRDILYEPSAQGSLAAREAIVSYYQKKGFRINPEQVFFTASTSEAYGFLFRLLADAGEHILVPRPSYPLFEFLAQLNDAVRDDYPLIYDGKWSIDIQALAKAISPKTKALLLVNPNNPTGSYIKEEELFELNRISQKYNLAIICDEVFSDYRFDQDENIMPNLIGNSPVLTFSLAGASKSLGLPQMKIGWVIVSGPDKLVETALERLEIILDTYLSVNTPAINALPAWFNSIALIQQEIFEHLMKNREYLMKSVASFPACRCLNIEGGWYAILKLPLAKSEEEWSFEFLEKDHVLVHPGYFFDFQEEGYIVVSLLVAPENFQEGINRIIQRVQNAGTAHGVVPA